MQYGVRAVRDRTDAELIQECLDGHSEAWDFLVHRYSRLIYSIPFKWGLQREDAKEIYQSVWLDCFQELHSLRDINRLQAWLVRIAIRKCYRFSTNKRSRPEDVEIVETDHASEDPSEGLIARLDREQLIRMSIAKLTERCQQVIKIGRASCRERVQIQVTAP